MRPATTILTAGRGIGCSSVPQLFGALRGHPVVDGIRRNLAGLVVAMLERIGGPTLRGDERRHLLRVRVAQAAGIEVGHRVADDACKRVDARGAGAVVPRSVAPQRS